MLPHGPAPRNTCARLPVRARRHRPIVSPPPTSVERGCWLTCAISRAFLCPSSPVIGNRQNNSPWLSDSPRSSTTGRFSDVGRRSHGAVLWPRCARHRQIVRAEMTGVSANLPERIGESARSSKRARRRFPGRRNRLSTGPTLPRVIHDVPTTGSRTVADPRIGRAREPCAAYQPLKRPLDSEIFRSTIVRRTTGIQVSYVSPPPTMLGRLPLRRRFNTVTREK